MTNFSFVHDLSSLSETARQEYLAAASGYFGLDPNLGALDLIWMDGGDGKRRLIAYARRGTTDILRGIHGINVLSIAKDSGPGYVSFTAVGKNRDGRQEIAVGAASLEGLKGDKLAAAVATAQTRALRRLTLQFVGGGLLDESELNETTVDINRANTSLASMATLPAPQPVAVINSASGADVTKTMPVPQVSIPSDNVTRGNLSPEAMIVPEPFSGGSIIPESAQALVQIESAEPKRRRRRTKAEMEAARNEIEVQAFSAPEIGVEPTHHEPVITVIQEIESRVPTTINEVAAQVLAEYPTADQEADYRKRLQTWVDILKAAGMTGGINWRLKRYTLALFPDAVVDNGRLKLTTTQWDTLLNTFNDKQHQLGPQALVAEINAIAEKA